MEWTEEQRSVIESDARFLICSAAAGSGKTAVLVERIIRFLKNGAEPESFLIITFTNAAAAEMREKIRNRLIQERQNPLLRRAFDQMDLMQISTIHSFCQKLIGDQFQELELDPMFRICDTSQRTVLFHEAYSEACGGLESENHPLYSILKQRFENKKTEQIVEKLYTFLMSLPEPMKRLHQMTEQIPDQFQPEHPWMETLRSMCGDHFSFAETLLRGMQKMLEDPEALDNYRTAWEKDMELFHVKQSAFMHPAEPVSPVSFSRLNTPRGLTPVEMDWKDRYQKLRNALKEEIDKIDTLLVLQPEKHLRDWANLKESLEALAEITVRTDRVFSEKKKEKALVDFHDLEQYAFQILSVPEIQAENQAKYRYIFVDECQDVSEIQDSLITKLHHRENHLFMVGDVKQSIYRFRLADPTRFMERIREAVSCETDEMKCIYLQANFRSRPEILETTNIVFRSVMKKNTAEMDYSSLDELKPGRQTAGRQPVYADILAKGQEDLSELEMTADHLANQIRDLLQTPYPEKNRNYQYRDCVILMPAVAADGLKLTEMLKERDIPVFFDGSGDYFQQKEIQIMKNLLEWIDNPMQDLPLISVLQNPPFSFSEESLSQIRLRCPGKRTAYHEAFSTVCEENSELGEKCRNVRSLHQKWQEYAESMRLSDFLWFLMQQTGFYWSVSTEADGELRQANLRMLANEAEKAERNGILTLRQFLSNLRNQYSFGDQQSATLLGDQDNLVRIMTIHKSKGLQFPVVFCCGMDHHLVKNEEQALLCHAKLGICLNYKDPEHRISRPTLATDLFRWKKTREELAEKIRLLYVAMTRAQERMYLITCQEANPVWVMAEGEGRVLSSKTYTDLWMPALMQPEKQSTGYTHGEKPYEIRVFEKYSQKTVDKQKTIHSLKSWLDSLLSAPVVDDLWKEYSSDSSRTLVKRSVTSLIRSAKRGLEEDQEEETIEQKRMPEALAGKLRSDSPEEFPAFLREEKKITAAWRGTLTHRILSQIDLESIRNGTDPAEALQREKEKMLREHMMTPEEMTQIRDQQILSFLSSPIGVRMINAEEVHREWNFNLRIQRDQEMILQGVIDCAFREADGWVILDYKTDEIRDREAFVASYRPQIEWYALAVSRLTGQPVKEAALYALSLDQVFPVIKEGSC